MGMARLTGVLLLRLVAGLALALCLALPAAAEEVIRAFSSNIELFEDGSVDVTETIDIMAEGIEIRHGIYRDIPTVLVNDDRSRLRSSLDVKAVTLDGSAVPFDVEGIGNGYQRIRIGDAESFVARGLHRYTIRYTMTRMGRSFADHDELFWNATGNFWVFPITTAVANITLPEGAVISRLVGYTGARGATEQAVTITKTSDRTAIVRTTRRLGPGEGMSVAAAFQPGVLSKPEGMQAGLYWLSDHRDLVVPVIGLLLVLLYNYFAWNAVGRDPKRGTIIPLFHEPKGTTPALVHYVDKMGWAKGGWTAFTATLFDLGVKGLISIDNSGKTLLLTSTGKPATDLDAAERKIFEFVSSRGNVTISTAVGPKLNETRQAAQQLIERENKGKWFTHNVGYTALGVLLSILVLGAMVVLGLIDGATMAIAAGIGIALSVVVGVLRNFFSSPLLAKLIVGVWVVLFAGNIFGAGAGFLSGLQLDTPLIGAISIIAVEVFFAWLMPARSVAGRALQDQIDGFRMYLDTAEKNRLNITNEPPMTVERFERILPYAIALGVEKPWSQHFEAELARGAVADAGPSYQPLWYGGHSFSADAGKGISNSVSTMAAAMSAAMIASQPSSSSGSGFSSGGGGGGSGGGGGGGGGGGW